MLFWYNRWCPDFCIRNFFLCSAGPGAFCYSLSNLFLANGNGSKIFGFESIHGLTMLVLQVPQGPHTFSWAHGLPENMAHVPSEVSYLLVCTLREGRGLLPSLPDNETGCPGHWSGPAGRWIIFPLLLLAVTWPSGGEGHYTAPGWVMFERMWQPVSKQRCIWDNEEQICTRERKHGIAGLWGSCQTNSGLS